jgi:hypothetical protein
MLKSCWKRCSTLFNLVLTLLFLVNLGPFNISRSAMCHVGVVGVGGRCRERRFGLLVVWCDGSVQKHFQRIEIRGTVPSQVKEKNKNHTNKSKEVSRTDTQRKLYSNAPLLFISLLPGTSSVNWGCNEKVSGDLFCVLYVSFVSCECSVCMLCFV